MSPDRYKHQCYLLMTLDPVHPGAGGYRLGRVDNSIARDPGTRLPKIPGSSLHGAARSYAAYLYETPEAAGQSQEKIDNPAQNPVCYTFGYIKGKQVSSGVVNIFDAHLLLFPVHSMVGPVWVTCPAALANFEINCHRVSNEKARWPDTLTKQKRINLGWLMLERDDSAWQPPTLNDVPQEVRDRLVLVPDNLFPHIVNSNLEVRTSVAINPETGAAEGGALYTYEAIPRAAFLTAEVVLDDYAQKFPADKCRQGLTEKQNPLPGGKWEGPLDVVRSGLKMIEYLSVGGMGTRGFGRIKVVGKPVEKSQEEIFKSLEGRNEP